MLLKPRFGRRMWGGRGRPAHAEGGTPPALARLLARAQVHLGIFLGEDVVEAALRQPHVERHLAAFEAEDRHARTAGLALLAAAGGLAEAGTDAAADADAALAGAGIVTEIVELDGHCTRFRFCRADGKTPPPQAGEGKRVYSATDTMC